MTTTKRQMIGAAILAAILVPAQSSLAFYGPSTGRWLSRDPIGEPGFEALRTATYAAKTTAHPPVPHRWINRDSLQSQPVASQPAPALVLAGDLNRYLFVQNNPNGLIDSDGLGVIAIPFPAGGAGAGVGAGATGIAGPIGGAFCVGAAIGTALCNAFPDTMTKPGEWIANCFRPKEETCRLANQIDRFCIYTCPSGAVRVGRAGLNGCVDTKNFPVPGPNDPLYPVPRR